MIATLFAAISLLFALMAGWVLVQRAAERVAEQHPECGPLRLVGGGCGGHGHAQEAAPPLIADGCASCDNTSCKPATLMTAD